MSSPWQDWLSNLKIGKNACYRCRKNGRDRAGNNFHFYGEGKGGFCHSCEFTILSDDEKARRGLDVELVEEEVEINIMAKEITKEDIDNIKRLTTFDGRGLRGISNETYELYRVRHEYCQETGQVLRQYYPNTKDGKFASYKVRSMPKDFYAMGEMSNDLDLFGQWLYKAGGGKYVAVLAGEIDCLSAHEMLNKKDSGYGAIPCVSAVNGESGSHKQLQKHYAWFSTFEKIVLIYDNDDAGKEAVEKVAKILPKGKVFVVKLNMKDTNEYLKAGREKEWVNLFYRAEKYTPAGVISSKNLYSQIVERASIDKISLPPFMVKLEDMMCGGIPLKSIVFLTAASGQGKTSFVNELVLHWIFNTPFKVGVCSLESDCAEYGENLLSRHIGRKLSLIRDKNEKQEFLSRDDIRDKAFELLEDEYGNPRFFLNDDRGDFGSLQSKIEQMIVECGCQIIVIDPVSDVFAGMTNEQVELFMSWSKQMTKSHNVTFVNIAHTKKIGGNGGKEASGSTGAMITEESITGSSSQYKSSSINIILVRNKLHEDVVERNCTKVFLAKCRHTGFTGPAGEIYYDSETHTLYDKEYYFTQIKPAEF